MVFSLFNPMMSYPYTVRGVSPMQAVAIQAEMDMTANKWNWNFFKQGATVGGTLETEQAIDQVSKKRLIEKWNQEFQ
jgi:phage portal protein BeeE